MFICFEGMAGVGKTTQSLMLEEYIIKHKKRSVLNSAVYEGDRRKLVSDFMNKTNIKLNQNAIMFLFQALHSVQYTEVKDSLNRGKVVIADRWRQSFFAYHVYADTFMGNYKLMDELDVLAYSELEPDIVFLIDAPVEIAYDRYLKREISIADEGLDKVDLKYFIEVRNYYLKVAKQKKWKIIDGAKKIDSVFADIKKFIDEKI